MTKNEKKASQRFYYLKKLLADDYEKEYTNGFYFSKKAVRYLKNKDLRYHINEYYDLTISNFLNYIEDNKNLTELKKSIFEEYNGEYATSIYYNFVDVIIR